MFLGRMIGRRNSLVRTLCRKPEGGVGCRQGKRKTGVIEKPLPEGKEGSAKGTDLQSQEKNFGGGHCGTGCKPKIQLWKKKD